MFYRSSCWQYLRPLRSRYGCTEEYMPVYLGIIRGENMQIEGFWYYLFTGVFEAATIHYAVAKIF